MNRIARSWIAVASLVLATPVMAQERQPAAGGTPRGERPAGDAAPRGERKPGDGAPRGERAGGSAASREFSFPAEVVLSEEQQAKLKELEKEFGEKITEVSRKRESILNDEQKTARREAEQKLREGNLNRQEATELLANALKLTPEQKTQMEAVEKETMELRRQIAEQKSALLNDAQKTILRKSMVTAQTSRMFSLPDGLGVTDEQKASLKALKTELGAKLAELTERQSTIMTDERRAAREKAFREATANSRDRQQTFEAVEAALGLSDAEKTELAQVEKELRELQQQIQERRLAILTDAQRAELEKRAGPGRGR